MYGLLQPLVVTRKEVTKPDGGLVVEYELIENKRIQPGELSDKILSESQWKIKNMIK